MTNQTEELMIRERQQPAEKDPKALISEANLVRGATRLKKGKALKAETLILNFEDNTDEPEITVGMTDPSNQPNLQMIADELSTRWQNLTVVEIKPENFHNLFQLAYGQQIAAADENDPSETGSKKWNDLIEFGADQDADADTSAEKANETAPVLGESKATTEKDFVQQIMRTALQLGTSDLHFDMGPTTGMVRFRIDGVLYNKFKTDFGEFDFSEIDNKVLLKMCGALANSAKVNYEDMLTRPYDGSLDLHYKLADKTSRKTKVRFASTKRKIETGDGRGVKVTLRLNQNMITDISTLGLEPEVIEIIRNGLKYIGGIGFVAGGTGSGKTNILASMHTILREGYTRQVMEYADTIEQMFDGMTQTETSADCGEKEIIKSYLRHDPDVVIGSEVRDAEATGKLVELATSGKLVLSTVHVSSMPGIFIRLEKLGIDRYSQSETLRFVIFTTLARKLCEECKERGFRLRGCIGECFEYVAREGGCIHCRYIGYRGRTAIAEALCVTSEVADWIAEGLPGAEICRLAEAKGWLFPLKEAIGRKIAQGITSKAEILRVIDLEKRLSHTKKKAENVDFDWRTQPSKQEQDSPYQKGEEVEFPPPPAQSDAGQTDLHIIEMHQSEDDIYSIDDVELDWHFDEIDDQEADDAIDVLDDITEPASRSDEDKISPSLNNFKESKTSLNGNNKH